MSNKEFLQTILVKPIGNAQPEYKQDIGELLSNRQYTPESDLHSVLGKFDRLFEIKNERYLILKVLGQLPKILGEKGQNAVTYWEYIRWMDDICDDPNITTDVKFQLLHRQFAIHRGEPPKDLMSNEKRIINLQSSPFTQSESFKRSFDNLLSSFIDDIDHQNLQPRNAREFRHYNYRTQLSVSEIFSHAINGKALMPTARFVKMLYSWNGLGNLMDIMKDLDEGKLQFELSYNEFQSIFNAETVELKKNAIKNIITAGRFKNEKEKFIHVMSETISSVWDTDLHFWQKLLTYAYMRFRAIPKSKKLIQFKENTSYVNNHQLSKNHAIS